MEADSTAGICGERMTRENYNLSLIGHILEVLRPVQNLILLSCFSITSKRSGYFENSGVRHSNKCSIVVAVQFWIGCRSAFCNTIENPAG